jgi:hypothetical protein
MKANHVKDQKNVLEKNAEENHVGKNLNNVLKENLVAKDLGVWKDLENLDIEDLLCGK